MAQVLRRLALHPIRRPLDVGRALACRPLSSSVQTALSGIVGQENVSTSESVRQHHGHDESFHSPHLPDCVVFPHSIQEVSEIARYCFKEKIPVVPFGTGTGLEGGVVAEKGGVCVDLTKMNKVLDLNQEDFDVTVEPGVTRGALNKHIKDVGLWFPVDPGSDCSLCGMVATGASGTNAVRYGTMRQNVLNAEVVLADGRIIWTGGKGKRVKKCSAGYNLTSLFVGSEGTLGFITKATLRLHSIPEAVAAAVCCFPTVRNAVDAAVMMLQAGIPVARIELLDELAINACNKYSKLNLSPFPSLFLEFHGSLVSVEDQIATVKEITEANHSTEYTWAKEQEDRNRLWKARHDMWYAVLSMRPGSKALSTDVCVPITNLTRIIMETKEDLSNSGLQGAVLGHVGDGNFHCFVLMDTNNPEEVKRGTDFANRLARRSISMNGTCTGEHGIGLGKMDLLQEELGEDTYNLLKDIKHLLDPRNIMNPGKVLHM